MKGYIIRMKKTTLRFAAVFIITLFMVSIATVSVSYAVTYTNSKGTITVKCGKYKKKFTAKKYGKNFSKALNAALETARKKGKASKIAKVTVSKGNYSLDRTIRIFSNTYLSAKNCRFRYYGNLLRNGYKKNAYAATGYSGAKNITIDGGIWDAAVPYSQAGTANWRIQHSTMRFAHCEKITIKNCSFVGNYNCHDVEFGAVNNSKIYKCSFSNEKPVNTFKNDGGREAIQFDVATYEAMPEFVYYDKTPTKNIVVRNCNFKNKFRGIGSHHAVPGKLFDNISVYNNTFENIGGIAVYGVYWSNSKIYNNTMTDVGLGVDIRSMTIGDGYNFRNLNKLSNEQCENKLKDSKLYIYGNTIKLRVKDNNYVRPTGIRVMGEHYDSLDLKTGIHAGTYKVYNVNVGRNEKGETKPNIISGNGSVGVQLNYAVNSCVVGNTIDLADSVGDESNGVELKGCDNVTVEGNTLKNGVAKSGIGVFLTYPLNLELPSTNITVKNNDISSFTKDGVFFHYTENSEITENKFSSTGRSAVNLGNTEMVKVYNNEISTSSTYGVYLNETTENCDIFSNNIENCQHGVLIKNSLNNNFTENTITSCSYDGIYVYSTHALNTISKNSVSQCPIGVTIQKSDKILLSENIISNTSSIGVKLYSASEQNIVSGNIISDNEYGVYTQFCDDNVIKENSVSGSAVYGVNIHGGMGNVIEDNEISGCTTNPIRINFGADLVEIKGNTINHNSKDSIYINGSSDSDKSFEKFVSVHDNIINCPQNKPCISGAYGNVGVQAYSNIFNGTAADGKEPKPCYMRFKGDEGEYSRLYYDMKLTDISIQTFEDKNHLEWNSPYDNIQYRVGIVTDNGKVEQIAVTNEKQFDVLFDSESKYVSEKYWVAPIIDFDGVKYLGMALTADYDAPEPPTTTQTEETTVESTEATDITESTELTEPTESSESETATDPTQSTAPTQATEATE